MKKGGQLKKPFRGILSLMITFNQIAVAISNKLLLTVNPLGTAVQLFSKLSCSNASIAVPFP